jgi:hypothetical protein
MPIIRPCDSNGLFFICSGYNIPCRRYPACQKKMINFKVIFAIPAFTRILLGLSNSSDTWSTICNRQFMVTKNLAIMLFFCSRHVDGFHIHDQRQKAGSRREVHDIYYPILILQAFAVGMVTLSRCWWWFLIVPALIFLAGTPIKRPSPRYLSLLSTHS